MAPSSSRREGGTLQKATFRATYDRAFTGYDGDRFHLLVRSQSGWASPEEFPRQRYALAVTLEHRTELDLYNRIEQRILLPERVRVRP
jgi:hypothetical protein